MCVADRLAEFADVPPVVAEMHGELLQRHGRTVVVDMDLVQHAGMGAAGTDLLQFGLERFDGAAHLGLGGLLDVCGTHDLSSLLTRTRVPDARGASNMHSALFGLQT